MTMTIDESIRLPDALPTEWPGNLCKLPKEIKQAIEEDRRRYAIALGWLQTMRREAIERRLAGIETPHVRADMKRRLNETMETMRELRRKQATQNNQPNNRRSA